MWAAETRAARPTDDDHGEPVTPGRVAVPTPEANDPNAAVFKDAARRLKAAGLDVVVEGTAVRVEDDATLHRLADGYRDKYGDAWSFDVADGGFRHGSQQVAHVFRVEASTIFGFGKSPHTQTRWRF